MSKRTNGYLLIAALVLATGAAEAGTVHDVFHMPPGLTSLETVSVGNAGNAGELSGAGAGGLGPDRICGAVDYRYNVGKYEVTAGQYTEFLKAVARTDTYGLYSASMWSSEYGCKIQRSGSSGSYTYSVAADRANRPVNFVSWGDAARFANWLHNGQPTGAQDLTTTEDGAYYLNGATDNASLLAVSREAGWKWAIPTEDEWYKAAYYDGSSGAYYEYPTGNDSVPSNDLIDPDPGNNANFYQGALTSPYTIGPPYYTTEVGEFEHSESPYGTFDQGGNLEEWTEGIQSAATRTQRGGGWDTTSLGLAASARGWALPAVEFRDMGFRVASVPVPEPSSITLLVIGLLTGFMWWKRRR